MLTWHWRLTAVAHPSHIPVVGVLERWPPYPVRWWIQEPETPSPVASQIACLHWGGENPQEMCAPSLRSSSLAWRSWGQRSVPEVGCRLNRTAGTGLSGAWAWRVTTLFFFFLLHVCVFVCPAGSTERRTQDSSVRTRDPPAAFLQLYGKTHCHQCHHPTWKHIQTWWAGFTLPSELMTHEQQLCPVFVSTWPVWRHQGRRQISCPLMSGCRRIQQVKNTFRTICNHRSLALSVFVLFLCLPLCSFQDTPSPRSPLTHHICLWACISFRVDSCRHSADYISAAHLIVLLWGPDTWTYLHY